MGNFAKVRGNRKIFRNMGENELKQGNRGEI